MDYKRLVKAAIFLVLGIFLGKPVIEAVDGAVTVYQDGQSVHHLPASKGAEDGQQ